MRKLLLISAAFFAVMIQVNFAAAQADRVVIYSDTNFRGDSLSLTSNWSGGGKFDRNVKSIKVPKGYRVTLYADTNYRGAETVLTEDWNPGEGAYWTTSVRSIRIQPTATQLPDWSPVPSGQPSRVTIYTGANFGGASQTLTTSWRGGGRFDRNIKSIRVPQGLRVTLFGDTNYRGAETVLTEDWNPGEGAYWTNRVRSIRIDATATQLPENPNGTATQLPGNAGGAASQLPGDTPVPTGSFPVLYAGTNFKGPAEAVERDKTSLPDWDGSPHTIRSIRVPQGWYFVVYTQSNFRGRSYNISSDITFAPGDEWYNRIRSIKVYKGTPPIQPR